MELLPSDCLKIIFNDVDDRDFINVLMVSKFMSSWRNYNLKVLNGCYRMSKIMKVINVFTFTNILYDFEHFEIKILPKTIKKITFDDNFNDRFDELFMFKIQDVSVGMFYDNDCYGMDNVVMTCITNRVFSNLFNCSMDKLKANIKNGDRWFLLNFKRMWTSAYKKYSNMHNMINASYFYGYMKMDVIGNINCCINRANNYECKFYKPDDRVVESYMPFLNFHIKKIMIYLDKLKKIVCDKYDKVRCEFMDVSIKEMGMFKLYDVRAIE